MKTAKENAIWQSILQIVLLMSVILLNVVAPQLYKVILELPIWCHDTQYNEIQNNENQHNKPICDIHQYRIECCYAECHYGV